MNGVLVLAAGGEWESHALKVLGGRRDLAVVRRCVDVADLLAAASTGQAATAVVDAWAPGLDEDAVAQLRRHQIAVVAMVPDHRSPGHDGAAERVARLGLGEGVADVSALPAALLAAVNPVEPPTSVEVVADPAPARGRVIVVWGPEGAPGRSTVALGIAHALAEQGTVTVIDADPMGGSLAQALAIVDEPSGLLAAARRRGAGGLVGHLGEVVREVSPGLLVATGLPHADRWAEVRSGVIEELIDACAQRGAVVVDVGACLEVDDLAEVSGRPARHLLTLGALAVADEIVAVGLPDPVGLARLVRGLATLPELSPAQVRVVINQSRDTMTWTPRHLEALVREAGDVADLASLPWDRAALDRALLSGTPPASGSAFGKAMAALVDRWFTPKTAKTARRR